MAGLVNGSLIVVLWSHSINEYQFFFYVNGCDMIICDEQNESHGLESIIRYARIPGTA